MRADSRQISSRTPLRDHAGEILGWYDEGTIRKLLTRPDIMVIGTRKRITGLCFAGPDPSGLQFSGSHHKRQAGTPHNQENYWNVRGVWHIDRIPGNWRRHYLAVLKDRHAEAAGMG